MSEFVDRLLESEPKRPGDSRRPPLAWIRGGLGWLVIVLIVGIWLATGIYQLGPAEVGLVKRFGRHVATTDPGLHYHWPAPIGSVVIVNIQGIRNEEIGFRTVSPPPNPRYQTVESEALMLTGDRNIIDVSMAVQYTVKNPELFAFNLIVPGEIVKQAAEAVLRERVATRTLDQALTGQRDTIGTETLSALQTVLDEYNTGIRINNVQLQDVRPPKEVTAAFDDVNSARQDKERLINEADKYAQDIVPRARGEAQEIGNQAEAYKQERIKRAEGDVTRFLEVLAKYELGEDVTRTRMYIETMEMVLPGMDKIILPSESEGVLKLLNLTTDGGDRP